MDEKTLELIDLWDRLVAEGYHVNLDMRYFGSHKLYIHDCNDLISMHKRLGVPIKKQTWGHYMTASCTVIDDIEVTIWPKGKSFLGCRLIEEEIDVPEQVVPAHKEKRYVVECTPRERGE